MQGWFINLDQGQGLRVIGAGNGFTNVDLIKTGNCHEITCPGLLNLDPLQALETKQLADPATLNTAVIAKQRDWLPRTDRAVVDTANHDATQKIAVVQGGDLKLEGLFRIANGGWDVAKNGLKERLHVFAFCLHVWLGVASHAATKEVGEITLVVVGTEFEEKIQNLVDSDFGIDPGPVNFVNENNGAQTLFQSLLQNEAGLGHGAFVGIHNQKTAIHHAEHPLDFPTEVGVARGINNIDSNPVVINGGILRKNGNSAFALEIIGIEHTSGDSFPFTKDARLVQEGINQGGFAVVNVGNDRNIANRRACVFAAHA